VAHRALLENFFTLLGIPLARGKHHFGRTGHRQTNRHHSQSIHIQYSLQYNESPILQRPMSATPGEDGPLRPEHAEFALISFKKARR
jgi:hypothetical protein